MHLTSVSNPICQYKASSRWLKHEWKNTFLIHKAPLNDEGSTLCCNVFICKVYHSYRWLLWHTLCKIDINRQEKLETILLDCITLTGLDESDVKRYFEHLAFRLILILSNEHPKGLGFIFKLFQHFPALPYPRFCDRNRRFVSFFLHCESALILAAPAISFIWNSHVSINLSTC